MSELSGRRAVVTGGGRGAGEAIARSLAEAGASVLVAARTASEVQCVARDIGGGRAWAAVCDVTDEAQVAEVFRKAEESWGGLDILIHAVAYANREDLGISAIVVSGDSGGGNLALATALRAAREGVAHRVDGVYALCPYISNAYAEPLPELPSLVENDGLLVSVALLGAMAKAYTPDPDDARNPLAWPYHATTADLEGLPPHVISVNELDPLRDEGLAYFRRLLAAGVPARGRTVNGTFHAAENNYFAAVPDVARSTLADLASFARSL